MSVGWWCVLEFYIVRITYCKTKTHPDSVNCLIQAFWKQCPQFKELISHPIMLLWHLRQNAILFAIIALTDESRTVEFELFVDNINDENAANANVKTSSTTAHFCQTKILPLDLKLDGTERMFESLESQFYFFYCLHLQYWWRYGTHCATNRAKYVIHKYIRKSLSSCAHSEMLAAHTYTVNTNSRTFTGTISQACKWCKCMRNVCGVRFSSPASY